MPKTAKGRKIYRRMTKPKSQGGYGKKKGRKVYYASQNAGTITGTHRKKRGRRG